MRTMLLSAAMAVAVTSAAMAADGMVAVKSGHAVKETIDRLQSMVEDKGMTVFARVDHAAGAAGIGKDLRPTELLIFGNPQGGTPLMLCAQSAGIDLPMKALAWQDAAGQVWLGYNDPAYLATRHALGSDCAAVVEGLAGALRGLAEAATRR